MRDYDENNKLLLPPRAPGEGLPKELLDYYKEYCSHLKDDGSFRNNPPSFTYTEIRYPQVSNHCFLYTCFNLN